MRDIATKADNTTTLAAGDWNANQAELENAVTTSDQTLDSAGGADTDLFMLPQSMAGYAGASWGYNESGAANAHVVGLGSNLKPVTKYYKNMMVAYLPGNANTSTAVTVNVAALGVKAIRMPGGNVPIVGAFSPFKVLVLKYNDSAGYFEVVNGDGNPAIRFANEPGFAGVNAVVADIGASAQTTLVVNDSQTLTANLNITDNINVRVMRGGEFVKASTYTLNIEDLTSGIYQIFSGFSVGDITLGQTVEAFPQWWGITPGGTVDSITPIKSMFASGTKRMTFPQDTYLVSGTMTPLDNRMTLMFQHAVFKAKTGGTFTEMLDTGDSGIGKYLLWDIRHTDYSTYNGYFELDGNSIANIVGIGTSTGATGSAPNGSNSVYQQLFITNCTMGFLAQETLGSGFTGSVFKELNIWGCVQAMSIAPTHDDVFINVFRVNGFTAGPGVLIDGTSLNVGTFFITNGISETENGLSIGSSSHFSAGRILIEGGFGNPILMFIGAGLFCSDLHVSPTFDSDNNSAVHMVGTRGQVDIISNEYNDNSSNLNQLLTLQPSGTSDHRTVKITQPYLITDLPPVAYTAGASISEDMIVVSSPNGEVYYRYSSSTLTSRIFRSGSPRRIVDTSFNDLGFDSSYGENVQTITADGTISIDNAGLPLQNLQMLDNTSGSSKTQAIFDGASATDGFMVTLHANGADNIVITTTNKLPTTSRTLTAGTGVLVLQWSETLSKWIELVFI